MLAGNGNDHRLFRKKLNELGPIMGHSKSSQVGLIWLNQYPIVELYEPKLGHNTDINSAKVHQFNEISRQTLQYNLYSIFLSDRLLIIDSVSGLPAVAASND